MEKRVILAFVLSIAVMYAFTALYAPRKAPEPNPIEQSSATPPAPPTTPTAATVPPVNPPQSTSEAAAEEDARADKAEEIVLETPLYSATISNVGGVIKSYKLKSYSDGEGHPLELIDATSAAKVGWPLSIVTGDKAIDDELNAAPMVGHQDSDRLSLDYASKGLHVRKNFQLDPENYEFSLQASVTKDGKPVPFGLAWRGNFGDQSIPQDPAKKNGIYQADSAFKRVNLRGLKDQEQSYTTVRAGV